jgi:hypothetical protein
MNIQRLSTDFNARLHVEQDTDAQELNCLTVALPPYLSIPIVVHREGASMDALWADALAMVAHLRAQPWREVHPPHVFQPFGIITARNLEDMRREHEVRREMMIGELSLPVHLEHVASISEAEARLRHEQGVASLCRALDLMDGAPLPVSFPCPPLKALH